MIGLVITFGLFFYYLLMNLFTRHINKNYWKKIHYNKKDISENVTIKITENSIINYSQYSESKIIPQWVNEFQENKGYIYLLNIEKSGLIIPKKHFSEDEIEMIRKYYGK
jgi:hypothetical protein